jgi:hypothetical protein
VLGQVLGGRTHATTLSGKRPCAVKGTLRPCKRESNYGRLRRNVPIRRDS